MKKHVIIILVILFLTNLASFGQKKSFFKKERMGVGGNLELLFGNTTYVSVSPHFAYYLTENFAVGPGLIYNYLRIKYPNSGIPTKTSQSIGGRLFARYHLPYEPIPFLGNIAAYTEFEQLYYLQNNYQTTTTSFQNFYVGGGYFQRTGLTSGTYIMFLWNLNESMFNNNNGRPLIRVGFQLGL